MTAAWRATQERRLSRNHNHAINPSSSPSPTKDFYVDRPAQLDPDDYAHVANLLAHEPDGDLLAAMILGTPYGKDEHHDHTH